MKFSKCVFTVVCCAAIAVLAPGCGTLGSIGDLANTVVNTAANTAVKAVSPSTYTGNSKETYNSREPLKKRRNTLSSQETSRSWKPKSSHSATNNPEVGMPYKSRSYNEHSAR
jgi:hypothetical protein